MKRIAIFAFSGEASTFIHAMLNTLDMMEQGFDARLIIEGAATGLLAKMETDKSRLAEVFHKALEAGVIFGVCRVCGHMTGGLAAAERIGLPILDEMSGHPSFATQIREGYDIISL